MDVKVDGEIRVALSVKNLRALVRQVDGEQENQYLPPEGPVLAQMVRVCDQGDGNHLYLRVVVEEDDYHYGVDTEAERVPGPVNDPR